ncbi:MAG: NADPH-dependent assimilatory sulfite reductase hemoprotein subunit [Proteobacteria bacterium]|nr:NADPH-dependent assimilatory sulfite reductase hemoprotein subunit [Pseudomonadota bacterium]
MRGLKVTSVSKVEQVKRESRNLRGAIGPSLQAANAHFADAEQQLLKFHGVYQGYDRDSATTLKQQGADKAWQFMVRVKIPAGQLTAGQYLALDAIAEQIGSRNLRVTTRQGIQFHGVAKGALKPTIAAVNAALLTTLAACGDVVRNVTANPAPIADAAHRTLQAEAWRLSVELAPRTRGYHEIWVDGEAQPAVAEEENDALYGEAYLPRKFKIGLATPDDNSIDVLTNDLALIALFAEDRLLGYNVAVGGGLGMTHNKPKTYPRLATPVVFAAPDSVLAVVKAVVALQRDHGDRANRKHARLKYLVDEKGLPWVKAEIERRVGHALDGPRPMPRFRVVDHMGWHAQGDGRVYFGLPIANGRIQDAGGVRLRTALRRIFAETSARPILMPTQDILLADLTFEDRAWIESLLVEHGVELPAKLKPVARWAMACPALPSCGLALNEAERIRVPLIAEIEQALARHGLADETLSVRITGCPNGCARPYVGDIGLVGRTPDEYAIYLGGDFAGTRLNRLVFPRVKLGDIAATLEPLFATFAAERRRGEGFGDFCFRHDPAELVAMARRAEELVPA